MIPGKRFIAQVHSCQLQKFLRFFFCVGTATDVAAVILAAIIYSIHYLTTLKNFFRNVFWKNIT